MELTTGVFGEITIEKIKRNGATEQIKFKNLITNNGLNRLSTNTFSRLVTGCYLGTGTTEPTITDVDLTTRTIGTTNTGGVRQSVTQNYETGVTSRRWSFYFDFGQLNGNYSEIGFGGGTRTTPIQRDGSSTLFSKALIKDANGNPSVLTMMSDEAIRIHYTLSMQPDLQSKEGSFVLGGNLSKTVNYVAKTIGWNANFVSGLNSRGLRSSGTANSVNGIVTSSAKNYLLGLTPFEPIYTTELNEGFTHGTGNTTTSQGSRRGISLTREANAIGPGISRFSFLTSVAEWNVSAGQIHGLLLSFHGRRSGNNTSLNFGTIMYAILFDEPIIKDDEKRLGFTITHGWGRV